MIRLNLVSGRLRLYMVGQRSGIVSIRAGRYMISLMLFGYRQPVKEGRHVSRV